MSNHNKKGVNIATLNGLNDALDSVQCSAVFLHPFDAAEPAAAHSNGLSPANVINSRTNVVEQPTSFKQNTTNATDKHDGGHCGTAFVHPFVVHAAPVVHSNEFNSANAIYSNPNNDVKLPIPIKLDRPENTDTNVSKDSKQAPAVETDPDPWTLKKVCVTFAMGTSGHGFANANRLWVANYKRCSIALLTVALTMPTLSFLFGFIGMRDQVQPDYRATSITVVNDKETGLAIPRILISNSGIFNYSALQHHNVSLYEASLITTLLVGKFAYTRTLERNIDKVNKDYHNLLHRLNTSAYGVWNLLSYKCDEIIIDCLLNTKHIPGPTCCKEHFDTVLGSFGQGFISKTTFIQESEEVAAGLTLGLRVPVQALALDWNFFNRDVTLLKTGLRVSIIEKSKDFSASSSSVVPVHGLDRIIVTLSYTQHDNTGLYQGLFPWLNPAADCIPSDASYQELVSVEGNCVSNSLHVCASRLRDCSFVSYPFRNATDRLCDFKDQHSLIRSAEAAACRSDHVAKCGHLCQEDVYSFSAQSCPLKQFDDMLEREINSTWAMEGAMTIHYTRLGHTVFSQSKAHMVVLLNSLGGTMNTFMGFSFTVAGEMMTTLTGMILIGLITLGRKISNRGGHGADAEH